jgi:putative ABC transport system permease protein
MMAWPLAYFVLNRWLQNYAYRINIGPWIFALSGGILLGIALLAVGFVSLRASSANPANSLRHE